MVTQNNENPEEELEQPARYEDLVTEEPEREIDESAAESRTVTEMEMDAPAMSDLKAILNSLTPRFSNKRINEIAQPSMVSRIFPDNLLDKQKLAVLALLEEYDEQDENIPVIDIIMNMQDAMSIGYEGRGIVERLEIAGVAHEEELEKMAKDIGL